MSARKEGTRDRVPSSPEWLVEKEAAEYLRMDVRSLRRIVQSGEIRHTRIAEGRFGQLRFRPEWLDQFLEGKATGGEALEPRKSSGRFLVHDHYPTGFSAYADTIEEALQIVNRGKGQLQITDFGEGGGMWGGTPEDAKDPALLRTCKSCGHLKVWHHSFRMHPACWKEGCNCPGFQS